MPPRELVEPIRVVKVVGGQSELLSRPGGRLQPSTPFLTPEEHREAASAGSVDMAEAEDVTAYNGDEYIAAYR